MRSLSLICLDILGAGRCSLCCRRKWRKSHIIFGKKNTLRQCACIKISDCSICFVYNSFLYLPTESVAAVSLLFIIVFYIYKQNMFLLLKILSNVKRFTKKNKLWKGFIFFVNSENSSFGVFILIQSQLLLMLFK